MDKDIHSLISSKLKQSGYLDYFKNVYHREKELEKKSYAENFGIQWNAFQKTQFDSYTGLNLTELRLKVSSEWDLAQLDGKLILEMGSGAGRFTEIFLKYGAIVVSVEISSAAYANAENNKNQNLFVIKDSLLDFDCKGILFDYVFCYGVAQHVPNPEEVYFKCSTFLKPSTGLLSIDHYWKRLGKYIPCFLYYPKYLWRPITAWINPNILLRFIRIYSSFILPIDIFIKKRIPQNIYNLIRLFIPIPLANYFRIKGIPQSYPSLLEWCIMDTFDQLGARYDEPWTISKMKYIADKLPLSNKQVKVITKYGNGLILNATSI